MANNKKQLPIIDTDIKLIRKANEFVEARYKFDIWETRVFAYMLTLIKSTDKEFDEYKINVGDIVKDFGLNNGGFVYEEIKKASEKLLSKRVQIERTTLEGVAEIVDTYLVISTARPKEASKENYVKLSFHPALKPFLLELKQRYLVYDIRNILSLSSIYSIRLYELLKQYQKIGKRRFRIEELKMLLSIEPNEYSLYGHFKDRIIKKAQKDLYEHTDIYFDFSEDHEKKKVISVTFQIFDNPKNERLKLEYKTPQEKTEQISIIEKDATIEDDIFEKVNKYVSKRQVKKWVTELPIEQIEAAITYTFNYIDEGNKIKNVGGFLNTMVYIPNLYDKFEEKKKKVTKQTKQQRETAMLINNKKLELQKTRADFEWFCIELEKGYFERDPELEVKINEKIMKNQFYDRKKTLDENLSRDSIKGLKSSILYDTFEEYKAVSDQNYKKLSAIKAELEALGYRD